MKIASRADRVHHDEGRAVPTLDWSECSVVERVAGRLSGAWVFRDTRMPVSAVFKYLEAGVAIDEIIEQFDVSREPINAVLQFAARSTAAEDMPSDTSGQDADLSDHVTPRGALLNF